jgi:hypothetical protein
MGKTGKLCPFCGCDRVKSLEDNGNIVWGCGTWLRGDKAWQSVECTNNCCEKEISDLRALLTIYRIQCRAAMKARSLGLCKRVIKHAIEDDYRSKV